MVIHLNCVSLYFIASDDEGFRLAAHADAVSACVFSVKGSHGQSEGQMAHDSSFTGDKVQLLNSFSSLSYCCLNQSEHPELEVRCNCSEILLSIRC